MTAGGIPRVNPDGSIVIRSAPTGPIVTVGGPGGGGAGAEFHAIGIGVQEDPFGEEIALLPDSVLTFTEWVEGQAVFAQSVIQIGGTSDGGITFQLWWSGDGVVWEPFWEYNEQQIGLSEGAVLYFPLQGETPPIDNWESATVLVGVAVGISGDIGANVVIGHIQGQLFTPTVRGEDE